jgi:Arc/MetJ-type ribon-helix-helix transcriptional regulator
MKTISLKLPESLDAKLNRVAKQRDQTKSAVIREALERFLDGQHTRKKFVSALELAGDLVGCCQGPGDLSTNPKYMEGFGK